MRKLVAIAIAFAFFGTAGLASAQTRVAIELTTDDWMGDEPNTPEGGCVPYGRGDPSECYPADDNGFVAGESADGQLILAAKFMNAANAYTTGVGRNVDATGLLFKITGNQYIAPGHGQWRAWFGNWDDKDGDGYIRYTAAPVPTGGYVVDQRVCGRDLAAPCSDNEWTPHAASTIVAYLTPGNNGDSVNRAFGARGGEDRSPDHVMKSIGNVDGSPSGYYYAPSSNFEIFYVDNSLLETTSAELISEAAGPIADGPREYERDGAKADSLVESDVYVSVSADAEQVYQENVVSFFTASDCQVEYPEDCPAKGITTAYYTVARASYPVAGPTYSKFVTPLETEQNGGFDYTAAPHIYLDLQIQFSLSASLARSHFNYPFVADTTPTGDGQAHMWGQAQLAGVFGVWEDLNGDGTIGTAEDPVEGCDDAHQCGAVQDPACPMYPGVDNGVDVVCAYFDPADDDGEFTAACAPGTNKPGQNVNVQSSLDVTLSSSTGSWGDLGVYMITDRTDVQTPGRDPFAADGRVPFNPYDDMVLDASDGSVDLLIRSGDIVLHAQCTGGGYYYSYERLIVPGGNFGYDVTMTTQDVTTSFVSLGIPNPETIADVDVYAEM